jgi:phosphate transport system protein
VHLQREIEKVTRKLLALGTLVEENLMRSLRALHTGDMEAADIAIAADREIDLMEIDVEEECLKLLALYQPVAVDLRLVVAVLKINNDLERIGDLAKNIAKRARNLKQLPAVDFPDDFLAIGERTVAMLTRSLDAVVNLDAGLAREVIALDDDVDALNRSVFGRIKEAMRSDPASTDACVHLLTVSRNLERVGDHATNIAEDVIYMVEGSIIRHQK